MAEWQPGTGSNHYEMAGAVAATSYGTVLTAGAANTKGAYTQLIAATTFQYNGVWLFLYGTPGSSWYDILFDIAIGAEEAEQVVIGNILQSEYGSIVNGWTRYLIPFFVPVVIPAGSRLSARCQCNLLNATTIYVGVLGVGGTLKDAPAQGVCVTYGANEADSGGTPIDADGSVHTKGSWQTIAAATTGHTRWLIIHLGNQLLNRAVTGAYSWLVDIGIGAEGDEQIILDDLIVSCSSLGDIMMPTHMGPFPVDIPIGTRIAARAQTNDVDDSAFDMAIQGIG